MNQVSTIASPNILGLSVRNNPGAGAGGPGPVRWCE